MIGFLVCLKAIYLTAYDMKILGGRTYQTPIKSPSHMQIFTVVISLYLTQVQLTFSQLLTGVCLDGIPTIGSTAKLHILPILMGNGSTIGSLCF